MAETPIETLLRRSFPRSTRADWEKIATQEAKAAHGGQISGWRGSDDITFASYYDAEHVAQLPSSQDEPASTRASAAEWHNLPPITVGNITQANTRALEHLDGGADGLFFELQNVTTADLNLLLTNIPWNKRVLCFQLNDANIADSVQEEILKRKIDPASVRGSLFWESIPKRSGCDFFFRHCKNFRALGLHIPSASPVEEICQALLDGVVLYDSLSTKGDERSVFNAIAFSLRADTSFLETIAKLKALRMLWQRVAAAYGHDDYLQRDLYLHVRTQVRPDGAYAPHENMLSGTFSAIAAVLGNCDALTVAPATDSPVALRWARNVSSVLREESTLRKVSDPLAGSYTLESMVYAIGRKAWEAFQQKWKDYASVA